MPGRTEKSEKTEIEADLDALFKLPLAEFTAARNALAARLKKAGDRDEAERVKALAKPSISAWAVNQLYWRHRAEFQELIAVSERFAGKPEHVRELIAARHGALSSLARLAATLLDESGHNSSPETIRRITTTLEALSTSSSSPDAPRPGRLTADVDPPGFESLAAFFPSPSRPEKPAHSAPVIPSPPSADRKKQDDERHARRAAAKAALEAAEQSLRETRTNAQDAAAVLKTAAAQASQAEKDLREAEQRLEEARRRVQTLTAEAQKATRAVEEAEREVERARTQLRVEG